MNEQQIRITQTLLDLIENGGRFLRTEIITKDYIRSNYGRESEKIKSSAENIGGVILLKLVEPDNIYNLDSWADPIIRAEEMLGELEKERFYNEENPNFIKALQSKIYNRVF